MSYETGRAPYGYEQGRYESYKPNEDRGQSRDYSNNFERDQSRDMKQGRQDSRDRRDPREPRGPPRSPHLNKKGRMDSPKRLHIDTKVIDRPRRSSSSTQSSASAFSNIPIEPAANRAGRSNTNNLPSSTSTPTIPKAKDPKVQDVFDAVYQWNKILEKRNFLKLQNYKLLNENQKRQAELSKIGGKVDDYAPYLEFKQRFETSGKAERDDISKQLGELDDQCAENLERVVCALSSHTPINPQAAVQTASVSKLEVEFEKFRNQNSDQQKQITQLMNSQENSSKAFVALNQDFTNLKSRHIALESQHNTLESQHNTLESQHTILASKYTALESNYTTLESNYASLKSENSELRQQVADFNLTKDSVKRVENELDRLSKESLSFKSRIDDVESKVHGCIEKAEDLDMETYNEILEMWINHDFKNKVPSHETSITSLRQSFQSFQELVNSRLDKSETLTQGIGTSLQALETTRYVTPHTEVTKAFVEEKCNSVIEVTQKVAADSGDVCAEMVDEVRLRVDNLQSTVNTLSLVMVPSKDPDVAARIDALRQTTDQLSQNLRRSENRIEFIEGQRLGGKVDRVNTGLVELEKKITGLQEGNGRGGTASAEDFVRIVKPEIDDAKKRFDALELAVRVLDSQWTNLSSKQMAERILQHLNPYGQQTEARITGVENEMAQLRSVLLSLEQKILIISKDIKLIDIVKVSPLDGKRTASSESPSEELISKRRKLGSNNQFAPQQNRSTSNSL
ncbi:uncharacterized protein GGS22DRAFT_146547 [Annulohypoxylon maeteangense]|uniref:uncharacterized protein n=1 Tax=Annulohypoxylon maeteangense TaxID=1927788 RepID=UPI002007BBC1|nr:uncharacterized protein GGS22DRAFT_146547 [Annulohypoxylon maeteangense]KAI0884747.1 hypothetical protein GGS22DRAFT_146547 [Annulohypoxylon maeteangense]